MSTGTRVDLPNVGFIMSATLGDDGFLYAALIDPSRSENAYRIGRFDPTSLKLVRSWDTPIKLSSGAINEHVEVASSPHGEIWMLGS